MTKRISGLATANAGRRRTSRHKHSRSPEAPSQSLPVVIWGAKDHIKITMRNGLSVFGCLLKQAASEPFCGETESNALNTACECWTVRI